VQALGKIQFTPPPPFVMACATNLLRRLEAFVAGNHGPSAAMDVGVVTRIMTSLVAFKFDPPAPLLALVRPLRIRFPCSCMTCNVFLDTLCTMHAWKCANARIAETWNRC
jgi:hypothetical protein